MIRLCWREDITKAETYMRGSFAVTGKGHETYRALCASLFGYAANNPLLRDGIAMARASGLEYTFYTEGIGGAHPNSARFVLSGGGRTIDAVGASVGGGMIELLELNDFKIGISGQLPAIIVINMDTSGVVETVASYLSLHDIHIAAMSLNRNGRSGLAVMALEVDRIGERIIIEEIKRAHAAIVRTIWIPKVD